MLKKPFQCAVAGLVAAAAFSMTSIALADVPSDDSSINVSATATDDPFSTENGAVVTNSASVTSEKGYFRRNFYGLAALDYGFNTWKSIDDKTKVDIANGTSVTGATATQSFITRGLGGRIAVGYDINPFFGIEIGGFINPTVKSKLEVTNAGKGKDEKKDIPTNPVGTKTDLDKISSYGVDLVGKLHIEFGHFFGFAGGGVAWTHYSYSVPGKAWIPASGSNLPSVIGGQEDFTWNKFVPEVLGGVGYAVNDSLAVIAQYTYVFGDEFNKLKLSDDKKSFTDALGFSKISLGLVYKF